MSVQRPIDAQRDRGQSGLVEDHFGSGNSFRTGFRIGNVTLQELDPVVQMGEVLQRAGTQVVENPDLMPLFDKPSHQVRADKTSTACHKVLSHVDSFSSRYRQPFSLSRRR